MPRKPIKKELDNTKLLKDYASWIYCDRCNNTVAYLCYVTYDSFDFEYTCNCQNKGSIRIGFKTENDAKESAAPLKEIKNRLCCPKDNSPLITVVTKNLQKCRLSIVCNSCNTKYNHTH